jgi:hypothetical protein
MYVSSKRAIDAIGGITNQATVHICQVPTCTAAINRRWLVCGRHWLEVPMGLRDEVTRTLSEWLDRKTNAYPYLIARTNALIHVAKLHGIDCGLLERSREVLLNQSTVRNAEDRA